MYLKLGIAIGTSLLLASADHPDSHYICTSLSELAHPCGCAFSNDTFDPQCGSDGVTYLNACFLECQNLVHTTQVAVVHAGVCEHHFNCECHTVYKPVCGSDGVTYSNDCTLKCATERNSSIVLSHAGVCNANDDKQDLFGPKDNKCRNRGKCRKKTKDRRQFREYSYESSEGEQEFMRPSDENFPMPDINIEHHYKTTPKTTTETKILSGYEGPCVCTEVHRPVCASNKRTYANFCVLLCSSKIDPTIKLVHWGDCEMAKTTTTTPTPNDKNNKKSLNKETPDKHNHDNKKPTNHPTKKKCICAAVHWPICASNRKTYPNYCVFLCDQRKDHALHLLYWRECSERNDDYYQ